MTKILIVDDDVNALKLVGFMLRKAGYEIIVAQNGFEALEKAQSQHPDLVVSDLMMPKMDGYTLTRKLRADSATENVPIIMLTAKSQVADKVAGFEAGVNDYVTKPVMPAELIARIKAQLQTVAASTERIRPRAKIISVIGAKGGLGLTTLVVNLGLLLRKQRSDTILVDFQTANGAICQQLGMANNNSLLDILKAEDTFNSDTLERIAMLHSSGLVALPTTHGIYAHYQPLPPNYANAIVKYAAQSTDYVLIDLGTMLDKSATVVVKQSHRILLVAEPSTLALDLAKRSLQYLLDAGLAQNAIQAVLINRSRSSHNFTLNDVEKFLQIKVAGIVTSAPEQAFQTLKNKSPFVESLPNHLVSTQIEKIVQFIQ